MASGGKAVSCIRIKGFLNSARIQLTVVFTVLRYLYSECSGPAIELFRAFNAFIRPQIAEWRRTDTICRVAERDLLCKDVCVM